MKQINCFLLAFFSTVFILQAQEKYKPIKWLYQPSVGVNFSPSDISKGYITDDLVEYTKTGHYWQALSFAYYIKHWGIQFSLNENHSKKLNERSDNFVKKVNNEYSGNYFTDISSSAGDSYDVIFDLFASSYGKVGIGPTYIAEKNHFLIIGRVLLGARELETDWGSAYLKEKDTNKLIRIDWSSNTVERDVFMVNPSFTLGYRFIKNIALDFDFNFYYYNLNFEYTELKTDGNTGSVETKTYKYKSPVYEFSIGGGLIIIL